MYLPDGIGSNLEIELIICCPLTTSTGPSLDLVFFHRQKSFRVFGIIQVLKKKKKTQITAQVLTNK